MQGGQQRLVRGSTVSKLLLLLSTGCATNPRTTWLAGSVFNLSEHEARWPEHYRTGSTRTLSAPASPDGVQLGGFPKTRAKLGMSPGGDAVPVQKSQRKCLHSWLRRGSTRLQRLGGAQLDQQVKRDGQLTAIARARCLASGVRACAYLALDWSVNVDQQAVVSQFEHLKMTIPRRLMPKPGSRRVSARAHSLASVDFRSDRRQEAFCHVIGSAIER